MHPLAVVHQTEALRVLVGHYSVQKLIRLVRIVLRPHEGVLVARIVKLGRSGSGLARRALTQVADLVDFVAVNRVGERDSEVFVLEVLDFRSLPLLVELNAYFGAGVGGPDSHVVAARFLILLEKREHREVHVATLEVNLTRDSLQLEDIVVLDERVLQPVNVGELITLLVNRVEVRVSDRGEYLRRAVLAARGGNPGLHQRPFGIHPEVEHGQVVRLPGLVARVLSLLLHIRVVLEVELLHVVGRRVWHIAAAIELVHLRDGLREHPEWVLEAELDGQVVYLGDLAQSTCRLQPVRLDRGKLVIQDNVFIMEDEIVRRERVAVRPARAFTQFERPRLAAVRSLPGLGERRNQSASVLRPAYQPLT